MRYSILLIAFAIVTLSSCFSGNYIVVPLMPESLADDQAYISISAIEESESAEHAGCWSDEPLYAPVPGAKVSLKYIEEERPVPLDIPMEGFTDDSGRILFEELPAGAFTVTIAYGFNQETRKISTVLGEVSRIDVKF